MSVGHKKSANDSCFDPSKIFLVRHSVRKKNHTGTKIDVTRAPVARNRVVLSPMPRKSELCLIHFLVVHRYRKIDMFKTRNQSIKATWGKLS